MHECARHQTPPSITLRSLLLIVFSFVASFLLAAGAMALLRGADGPGKAPDLAEVEVERAESFPNVGPWRVAVAATLSGRGSSVVVIRGPEGRDADPTIQIERPRRDDAAAQTLQARLNQVGEGGIEQHRSLLKQFLDTSGIEGAGSPGQSTDDSRTAVASASRLGGTIANCPRGSPDEPATVSALKGITNAAGGGRPHVTLRGTQGRETVVSQVAILGGGTSRIAVAIVARVRSVNPNTAQSGEEVLEKVARWLDEDNLHAPVDYVPAC